MSEARVVVLVDLHGWTAGHAMDLLAYSPVRDVGCALAVAIGGDACRVRWPCWSEIFEWFESLAVSE